jgi:hypothetical protein
MLSMMLATLGTFGVVLLLLLLSGVSTLNPDSFFHAKQSLLLALTQLHAAFKSSTPTLATALANAKSEIEDIGLFE